MISKHLVYNSTAGYRFSLKGEKGVITVCETRKGESRRDIPDKKLPARESSCPAVPQIRVKRNK